MTQAEMFKDSLPIPLGTRARALEQFAAFLPRAGRDYQNNRNIDLGQGRHSFVSGLSPYVRHRILSEEELVSKVLASHSRSAASNLFRKSFGELIGKVGLNIARRFGRDSRLRYKVNTLT